MIAALGLAGSDLAHLRRETSDMIYKDILKNDIVIILEFQKLYTVGYKIDIIYFSSTDLTGN
jgi:hypothetical protein